MKRTRSREWQRELDALAAIPDKQIDLSDIPELTEEQLRRAIRGRFYRPVKKPVTMRLDADVVAWLKEGGSGYQTKANALLRREMVRSYRARKGPVRAADDTPRKSRKSRAR